MGCWAHARRKFVDAVKVNRDDAAAIQMVMRMDALFLVNRDARKEMTAEERLVARRQHGEVWAEEIRHECIKLSGTVLPKSALGKAVGYTLNMWPKLRRCFDHAEVELSNNLAENSDAAGGAGPQELAARVRQRHRRTEGRRDPVDRRIPPPDWCPRRIIY